ncbi:MAG: hydrogenase maturation nickel metallochaperone HypA [Clostridiales Family XIII bacterium]|jgi:hydrogenase nickel incorporation protein HypA/HybF|nr:hydrogenase maturation nickel metallochaperone HypA [Clostridiales Family XIII bacterium]
MHELGVVIEVVNTVEKFARENQVEGKIETLVLQIGELSSMIPKYIEAVYPAAINNTILQDTKLEIEILPGNARCADCAKVFNVLQNRGVCPACGGKNLELLCGKEFFIKEIVIEE